MWKRWRGEAQALWARGSRCRLVTFAPIARATENVRTATERERTPISTRLSRNAGIAVGRAHVQRARELDGLLCTRRTFRIWGSITYEARNSQSVSPGQSE